MRQTVFTKHTMSEEPQMTRFQNLDIGEFFGVPWNTSLFQKIESDRYFVYADSSRRPYPHYIGYPVSEATGVKKVARVDIQYHFDGEFK